MLGKLGKVKCSVMGHLTRDLLGLGRWSPVTAVGCEWAGTQQLAVELPPDWRVMDKALTPSPGRPRSRETLQTR